MDVHVQEQDAPVISDILDQLDKIIVGKPQEARLGLTCLLAQGHLLLEGLPGVGKTTLATGLSVTLGLHYQRIQFTSDLLPSDVLGVSIYDSKTQTFNLHKGPIFSQIVLADEINRAGPKTQSALLEAMEEGQVSIEGTSHVLSKPFFVIATQNPTQQLGTYPLPEAQLDRFMLRLELTYPERGFERALLAQGGVRDQVARLSAVVTPQQIAQLQARVKDVFVSDAILDYVQDILEYTRDPRHYVCGLSSRAGLALLQAARAWALISQRQNVVPEDIAAVLPALVAHRLHPVDEQRTGREIGVHLLENVAAISGL